MSNFPPEFFHGSPLQLASLQTGSTITPVYDLARVFSHKPSVVSLDEGEEGLLLRHNGTASGWIYRVLGVTEEDVYPHPRSSMPAGLEWLTRRELPLELIGPVEIRPEEFLSPDKLQELRRRHDPDTAML